MMIVECIKYAPQKLRKTRETLYTEYRLDFFTDWQETNFSRFPSNCILTCKGTMLCSELVDKMFSSQALVDIDIADIEQYKELIDHERLVLSMHLSEYDEVKIRDFCSSLHQAFAYKLIFEARSLLEIQATSRLLADYQKQKIIFNVTGKWAFFQRVLFSQFGSHGVYLGSEEEIFEGQPLSKDVCLVITQLQDNETLVIPIIGDHRVSSSGSIKMGNPALLKAKKKAVYLPIPASDIDEALAAIEFLRIFFNVGGIAITNPFKSLMDDFFQSGLGAINTLQIRDARHSRNYYHAELDAFIYPKNTDLVALQSSLVLLKTPKTASILIYGSGACAEAFVRELQHMGFSDISLLARNIAKAKALLDKYKLQPSISKEYDLLINASPLGQKETDDMTVLPSHRSLINLPLPQPMTLLEELAKKSRIPLVSSQMFWELQFCEQWKVLDYPDL